jgi:K(+)-stimulated pyrophosphate-energized sodium pump
MGLSVVSIGLGSISALFLIFQDEAIRGTGALAGFGMGASTVAIFARVAGGIFTKAADVGADLVGKIEKDLPEDDIRNPATIADNVGDNVGDVAGMGADLYSSFVGSIIASALLGSSKLTDQGNAGIALPYWISMSGIVAAAIGLACVSEA